VSLSLCIFTVLYIFLINRNCVLLFICASCYISDIYMLYYWISFNIFLYFYVICPLSFRAENNPDQWCQSRLLLIIFFNACSSQGPSISSWVSSLSLLRKTALAHPRKPQWRKKRKMTEQTILSVRCLSKLSRDRGRK